MNIVSKKTLMDYYTNHPQAKEASEEWHTKTKKSHWTKRTSRLPSILWIMWAINILSLAIVKK